MIFLNHSNIEQTMKYLNLSNNDLQKDVSNTMSNIFNSVNELQKINTEIKKYESKLFILASKLESIKKI